MALILDTNALAALADGDRELRLVIQDEPDLAVSAVVVGEYLFGVRQSRWRARYEGWLDQNMSHFLFLTVGLKTAERYAEIRAELKAAGKPVPSNDLWIAALAREHNEALVSRDAHFDLVRGLRRVAW